MHMFHQKRGFQFCLSIFFDFRFAEAYKTGTHYFVLLIITDGVITDMPQTKEAIVRVCERIPF